MAGRNAYEFNAPQFCDFGEIPCNSVESTGSEIWDNQGLSSSPQHDEVFLPDNNLVKLKVVSKKKSNNQTDIEKIHSIKSELQKRLSKSDGMLNIIGKVHLEKSIYLGCNLPKKSLSEISLKQTLTKKPITAMYSYKHGQCSRNRNVKTTEQIELEKIAELQRQTFYHLRANEIRLKKMKLQPRSSTIPKLSKLPLTKEQPKVLNFRKESVVPVEKPNPYNRFHRLPLPGSSSENHFKAPKLPKEIPNRLKSVTNLLNYKTHAPTTSSNNYFAVPKPKEQPLDRMKCAAYLLNPNLHAPKIVPDHGLKKSTNPPKQPLKEKPLDRMKSAAYLINPKLHGPKAVPDHGLKDSTNTTRIPLKKFDGIPFRYNSEKKTSCKPFTFNDNNNFSDMRYALKTKAPLSTSIRSLPSKVDKENVQLNKLHYSDVKAKKF